VGQVLFFRPDALSLARRPPHVNSIHARDLTKPDMRAQIVLSNLFLPDLVDGQGNTA
jgi:hypothetical protein